MLRQRRFGTITDMRIDLKSNNSDHLLVALDHPSLGDAVAMLAAELDGERRFFGTPAPKLTASGLANLTAAGGIRLGVMSDRRLIAMSRVDDSGNTVLAVADRWRGRGVGQNLLLGTLIWAAEHGHERIVFHSSWRSKAFIALADSVGATIVDHGRGRVDLIFAMTQSKATA